MDQEQAPRRAVSGPAWLLIGLAVALVTAGAWLASGDASMRASSGSMEPTLARGATFRVDRGAYAEAAPARGDVVVFLTRHVGTGEEVEYAKRVVALAGDRVALRANQILLDGAPVEATPRPVGACPIFQGSGDQPTHECPCASQQERLEGRSWVAQRWVGGSDWCQSRPDFAEVLVPDGHVFVLGDSRDHSQDSRHFGPIPLAKITGRVVLP